MLAAGMLQMPSFDFDTDDSSNSSKWKNWVRGFEIFAKANKIEDDCDKLNWMLHCAGQKVQNIYYALPDSTVETKRGPLASGFVPFQANEYCDAILKLQNFFEPKRNTSFERHVFRKMTQNKTERIDTFVVRLREQAERCDFEGQLDLNIKDQITSGCSSITLRKKILSRSDWKLEEILNHGRILEVIEMQQKSFESTLENTPNSTKINETKSLDEAKNEVCKIDFKRKFGSQRPNRTENKHSESNFSGNCGRCGYRGHKAKDDKCPARGKECAKCGGLNHFARKCLSRFPKNEAAKKRKTEDSSEPEIEVKREKAPINMINKDKNSSDDEDVFALDTDSRNDNKLWCKLGNIELEAVIDSGTRYNVVDRQTWAELKAKNVKTIHRQKDVDKGFNAYGGNKLKFLGMFKAKIEIAGKKEVADFYVADEDGKFLLGYETAFKLNVLKIGANVNQIDSDEKVKLESNAEIQEFGKIKGVLIAIPLKPEVKGVIQPYRRTPVPLENQVKKKINEMLARDIIEKVDGVSKWISAMVLTPKEDDIRICIDMRAANEAVERENYPMPTIEDFLPHMGGAKLFSKIDIKEAFHQVELAPESREITTFIAKGGLYRYKRLMFGISCAPEIFQKIMEQILSGLEGCANFSDDIIVYGPTKEIHDTRLEAVLNRLREYNVTLNEKKCIFGAAEIKFLGHHLTPEGINPLHDKVLAVKQFREPTTAEEVRSFLGLVNFVGRFIQDLSTITEPLRVLTQKYNNFKWGTEQQNAFDELKRKLTSSTCLAYYDVNSRTLVIADASPVGLGAVLVQYQKDGPRIISFASRSLTDTEKNYAQTEKEALALVWAVERFHFFLYGKVFELVTDHKALEVLFSSKSKPCARIERWVMRLLSYKFKVTYKPGKTNIADPLSRLIKDVPLQPKTEGETENYVNWIISHAEPKAIKLQEISSESKIDDEIQAVKTAIHTNDWKNIAAAPFKIMENELCFSGNILLRSTRIVIPGKLRERILQAAHEGHPGMTVMKGRLRSKVWWPKMDQDTENFVKKCKGCTLVSAPNTPEPLRRTELPSEPWKDLAIDFLGPLPSGHNLLVIVDYYSRFKEVEIMTGIDSNETLKRLDVIFSRFGFPVSITLDNGRQLVSNEFHQYCDTHNIILNHTIPYWPQQNGEVERQNRSLLKRLAIAQVEEKNWREELLKYLVMYRSSPHSTTKRSPAELMFNRKMRDKLPSIGNFIENDEDLRERDENMKQKGKAYADNKRNAKPNEIQVGDSVFLKRQVKPNKLATTFEPTEFEITERKGSEVIVMNKATGTAYRRNVTHVKKIEKDVQETESSQASPKPMDKNSTKEASQPERSLRKRKVPIRYSDQIKKTRTN